MAMRQSSQSIGITLLALITMALFGATPGHAHVPYGTYEDWSSGNIRGDRWQGGENFGCQEVKRAVNLDPDLQIYELIMRFRCIGQTASNTGRPFFNNALDPTTSFLPFTNPDAVSQIKTQFVVPSMKLTGCAANSMPSRIRPVRIVLFIFNDGSSTGPGDRTGDHFGTIQAVRDSDTTDPPGRLRVEAFVSRCSDPACNNSTTVVENDPPETVQVNTPFTLQVVWDHLNHQFLASVGKNALVAQPYAASDLLPAALPFVNMSVANSPANCTAGATTADATTAVRKVSTNASAVIP
jgi:hypothetical protein